MNTEKKWWIKDDRGHEVLCTTCECCGAEKPDLHTKIVRVPSAVLEKLKVELVAWAAKDNKHFERSGLAVLFVALVTGIIIVVLLQHYKYSEIEVLLLGCFGVTVMTLGTVSFCSKRSKILHEEGGQIWLKALSSYLNPDDVPKSGFIGSDSKIWIVPTELFSA